MTDWLYSEKVKDHFMNPRNVLVSEKGYDYDARGTIGNMICGDEMFIYIKVDRRKNVITDCKWRTFGCASAIASMSLLSEKVKGMSLDKAYNLSARDIMAELGGLPDHKVHCSVLGNKALKSAITDYYERNGMADKVKREEARTVCQCLDISDQEIENAVLQGVRTFPELQERTKLGTVCGRCREEAARLLKDYIKEHFT